MIAQAKSNIERKSEASNKAMIRSFKRRNY